MTTFSDLWAAVVLQELLYRVQAVLRLEICVVPYGVLLNTLQRLYSSWQQFCTVENVEGGWYAELLCHKYETLVAFCRTFWSVCSANFPLTRRSPEVRMRFQPRSQLAHSRSSLGHIYPGNKFSKRFSANCNGYNILMERQMQTIQIIFVPKISSHIKRLCTKSCFLNWSKRNYTRHSCGLVHHCHYGIYPTGCLWQFYNKIYAYLLPFIFQHFCALELTVPGSIVALLNLANRTTVDRNSNISLQPFGWRKPCLGTVPPTNSPEEATISDTPGLLARWKNALLLLSI